MRNIEIDRLRALAVLVTLYGHLDFILLDRAAWYEFSRQGLNNSGGVILFFAISGYVISNALVSDLDMGDQKLRGLAAFWIKRFTRIFPMVGLWVAIPLLLSWGLNSRGIFGNFADNLAGAPWALFSVFNFYVFLGHIKSIYGVYWSLSLEEQFYAIYPFFLLLIPNWKFRLFALLVAVSLMGLFPYNYGMFRMDGMIMGAILYFTIAKGNFPIFKPIRRSFGLALTFGIMVSLMYGHIIYSLILPLPLWNMADAFISTIAVWLATQQKNFILPLSATLNKLVDWIGTRSFGLYLIHLPCYQMAGELTWRFQSHDTAGWRAVLAAALIISITEICYRFLETPIRKWGRAKANAVLHHETQTGISVYALRHD